MIGARLAELKLKATEKANFYSGAGFNRLANEFMEFVNFFDEIESALRATEQNKEESTNENMGR